MTTAIQAYTCDFCPRKKRFASNSGAVRHEKRCFYNPIRRACASCVHFAFEKQFYEPETGYSGGGPFCGLDKLNSDPEASTVLRSECEFWKPKAEAMQELYEKCDKEPQ